MKSRNIPFCLFFLMIPFAGVCWGEVSVSYDDPEAFEDFSLHQNRSTEEAVIIFEKQIRNYWDRRLKKLVPEGWSLSMVFTNIDMAGDIQPWRHPTNQHLRYYADRFYPRLYFKFTFTDENGDVIREGSAEVADRNFLFGGSGNLVRDEFVFGYELEALRKWLDKLDLEKDRPEG